MPFSGPECMHGAAVCTLLVRDLDHDGAAEVIVSDGALMLVYGPDLVKGDGKWTQVDSVFNAGCKTDAATLMQLETVRPRYDDLVLNGVRAPFSPAQPCQLPAKPSSPEKK
jgi:hypothetical protein